MTEATAIEESQRAATMLNRLLQTLYRSLPMYLVDARPWIGPGDDGLRTIIVSTASDYRLYVERLADMIVEFGGQVEVGAFPMAFTGLHDLSVEYLLQKALDLQLRDVGAIQCCVENLPTDSPARPLAEEILGNARGHLERMMHPAG